MPWYMTLQGKATGVDTKTPPPKFSMWHVEFDDSPQVKAIWIMTQPSEGGEVLPFDLGDKPTTIFPAGFAPLCTYQEKPG